MADIGGALQILVDLGLPKAQQSEVAQWTIIALSKLGRDDEWKDATNECIGIHDIMQFINEEYGKEYAENSRETFRKQALHQFAQAMVVAINPDNPKRPTNSPNYCYALTKEALEVVCSYGTPEYSEKCAHFKEAYGKLAERYQQSRQRECVPVMLPDGTKLELSPGFHNELQAAVIEKFGPFFVPGSTVLYLGDTTDKMLHLDTRNLEHLGIPITRHDKLPDVLFHFKELNSLILVEVVTSRGPVSPKRKEELEQVLEKCELDRIYVTAFPNFREFKKHISNIAWDSEVWIEEAPTHIIHFNGPKLFLREK